MGRTNEEFSGRRSEKMTGTIATDQSSVAPEMCAGQEAFEAGYRSGVRAIESGTDMPADEQDRRSKKYGVYARFWWSGFNKARWDHTLNRGKE